MMRFLYHEKYGSHLRQFIKFGIVGLGNASIDFSMYFIGTRFLHLHFLLANVFSWIGAVAFSFTMNKYWTFKSRTTAGLAGQTVRFIIVSLVSLLLSVTMLYIFVRIFQLHDLVGKVLTIGIVVFWNFFMNKFWTFKNR